MGISHSTTPTTNVKNNPPGEPTFFFPGDALLPRAFHLLRDKQLSRGDVLVYLLVHAFSSRDACWASNKWIAQQLNLYHTCVSESVSKLVKLKLIESQKEGGKRYLKAILEDDEDDNFDLSEPTFFPTSDPVLPQALYVLRDRQMTRSDLLVYYLLATFSRRRKEGCWASNRWIAEQLNVHYKNVSKSLNKLQKLYLLTITTKNNRRYLKTVEERNIKGQSTQVSTKTPSSSCGPTVQNNRKNTCTNKQGGSAGCQSTPSGSRSQPLRVPADHNASSVQVVIDQQPVALLQTVFEFEGVSQQKIAHLPTPVHDLDREKPVNPASPQKNAPEQKRKTSGQAAASFEARRLPHQQQEQKEAGSNPALLQKSALPQEEGTSNPAPLRGLIFNKDQKEKSASNPALFEDCAPVHKEQAKMLRDALRKNNRMVSRFNLKRWAQIFSLLKNQDQQDVSPVLKFYCAHCSLLEQKELNLPSIANAFQFRKHFNWIQEKYLKHDSSSIIPQKYGW